MQLIGGGRGNVYATNPTNQFFGPICDDAWDIAAVTYHYLSVTKSLKYQHQQQAQYGSNVDHFVWQNFNCKNLMPKFGAVHKKLAIMQRSLVHLYVHRGI